MLTDNTYLVQLEKNAGSGFMIIVSVFLGARIPTFHVNVADFPGRRWLIIIALVDVSTKPKDGPGCDVI